MENTFRSKAESYYPQIILIAILISTFFYGCQFFNLKGGSSVAEDQQSIRKTKVLADNWNFQLDDTDVGEKEKWFQNGFDRNQWANVTVPQAWNCYEEALWQYQGVGWYSTTINPDDFVSGKKIEVSFGRVMYYSKVWLNGEFIGENIGGYLPFCFDITKYLKGGQENKLVLRVDNRARIEWLPAATQIEWIQYGGILEPVKLVSKSSTYIEDLTVKTIPENKGAHINCIVSIVNETANEREMECSISINKNSEVTKKSMRVTCKPNEHKEVNVDFYLEHAELWSPDTPVIYTANINLTENDNKIDNLTDRFGIRQISVKGTSILLNGKPIIIKGTHRYDSYGRFGPNPPENLVREELALMKSVGINTIRVHYPPSPDILNLYDEYGFLMMGEIPLNWWGLNLWDFLLPIGGRAEQSLDILPQAKSTLAKMIARDKNHPCIVFWSMANECNTSNEIGTTAMRELLKLAKSLDPTRLATFVASGDPTINPGFDEADIVCFNKYVSCNHISQIDSVCYLPLVKELALYRKHYGDKPIVMTEFGRQGIKGIHGDVSHSEEFQAAYIESMWKALKENSTISGGILWTWADYFHELHFALFDSYGSYGVVTRDGKHKKSLEALARMYDGKVPSKEAIFNGTYKLSYTTENK